MIRRAFAPCAVLLIANAANAARPLPDLLARVAERGVAFRVVATDEAPTQREYTVAVYENDVLLGNILIVRDAVGPPNTFVSHVMLVPKFRGLGVGTMLYVTAAHFVHRIGGRLESTDAADQEPDATAAWSRMVSDGWAEPTPGRPRFRLRPDLLAAGHFAGVEAFVRDFAEFTGDASATIPLARAWHWIDARVQPGLGAASGRTVLPGLVGGTMRAQKPSFTRAGIAVDHLFDGTINVGLGPRTWRPRRAAHRLEDLRWHPEYPAETFSLFDCAIRLGGVVTDAYVYHPHPGPEPKPLHGPGMMEIWAPRLPEIAYGRSVELGLDLDQVELVDDDGRDR